MTQAASRLIEAIGCEEASELLSGWIDGELTHDEARILDEHLVGCERCRAEQNRLEEVCAAFRSVTPVAPPPRVREEVLERIRQDRGGERRGGAGEDPRTSPRPLGLRRVLTAAVLLLAAGATFWWVGGSRPMGPDGREAAVTGSFEAVSGDLGYDAGCAPGGDCLEVAPCESPAECGGGPPCSNPGECDGGLL